MVINEPPREDRRRARSRAALVAAAERLFAARGPDAVAIDDVVAAADLAKGTFYNHFDGKDALADAVARAIRAEIEAEIAAANAGLDDPALRCARAFAVYLRFAGREPVRAMALARIDASLFRADAALNAGLRGDLEAGLASGRFAAPSLAAAQDYVIGVAIGALGATLSGRDARAVAADVTAMMLRGLGLAPREAARIVREAAALFDAGDAT